MKLPEVEQQIRKLKKNLDLKRVRKTYHNKHVDGSGNFGYVLIKDSRWFRVDGDYDSNKVIYNLRFSPYGEWKPSDEEILEKMRSKLQEVV